MDTATIIQIAEAIVLICVTLGLGVVAKFYLDGKKFIEMILSFLADVDKAKADGDIDNTEFTDLVDKLGAIAKQGKVVLDDVMKLKGELLALLSKKAIAAAAARKEPMIVKVPKGEGPGQ